MGPFFHAFQSNANTSQLDLFPSPTHTHTHTTGMHTHIQKHTHTHTHTQDRYIPAAPMRLRATSRLCSVRRKPNSRVRRRVAGITSVADVSLDMQMSTNCVHVSLYVKSAEARGVMFKYRLVKKSAQVCRNSKAGVTIHIRCTLRVSSDATKTPEHKQ